MTKRERLSLVATCILLAAAFAPRLAGPRIPPGEEALLACDHLAVALFDEAGAPELRSLQISAPFRDVLAKYGGEFRSIDPQQDLDHDAPLWQAAAALPRDGLPWIVASCGATGRGYSDRPPRDAAGRVDVAAVVEILQRVCQE